MPRGRADAPLIGAYMARHRLIPDLVLVSPAQRSVETWALVEAAFSKDAEGGEGRPHLQCQYRHARRSRPRNRRRQGSLLLVGHNPGLHDLATELIGSGDVEAREGLNEKLPTSGLVVIDFAFDDWSELHEHAGRLERYVTPRLIGGASD